MIKESPELLRINVPIEVGKIFSKEVTEFGNGAKIDFFKKFLGKNVLIVVLKENGKQTKDKKMGRKK